jgi:hypothetical protein
MTEQGTADHAILHLRPYGRGPIPAFYQDRVEEV